MVETATSRARVSKPAEDRRRLKILSLCCLYPNSLEPRQGIFVERRLAHLAELADVRVVAPFAIAQYGNPKGKRLRIGARGPVTQSQDGNLPVLHPRWFYIPLSGSLTPFWLFLRLVWTLARVRREFRFEVLDTHFGFPDGVTGALLAVVLGVPFTMTLRGNEPKHSKSRLGRLMMSWSLRRAYRVFAVSERLREFAIGLGALPEAVRTIPNGVDGDVFSPQDRTACRLKHQMPLDARIILSAGALVERKGHHRILQALKGMAEDGTPAQLVIAGGPGPEGQYEEELRELVSKLGLNSSVRFLGSISPEMLAEVMSAVDVFCLASTNEGWPNVVHEALACGAPVVATDVGAVPEMLGGGLYGVVVPVNDGPRLKEALKGALERNWDRQGISAWGRARCWRQVAAEVLEEIQTIVPRGNI